MTGLLKKVLAFRVAIMGVVAEIINFPFRVMENYIDNFCLFLNHFQMIMPIIYV